MTTKLTLKVRNISENLLHINTALKSHDNIYEYEIDPSAAMVASARGRGTTAALAVLLTLHCVAIALFVRGFLLTRIHLSEKSTQDASVCARPYDKLIWIVIDALRWVLILARQRLSLCIFNISHISR